MAEKIRIQYEIDDKVLHGKIVRLAKKQRRTIKYMLELAIKDCIEKYNDKPA